jgi:hypothetical protein
MKTMNVIVAALLLMLLVGCDADATKNSEGGAKAKAAQLVTENIERQYGAAAEKSTKIHYTYVERGKPEDLMFITGNADYIKEYNGTKTARNMSFNFKLQFFGDQWNVKDSQFYNDNVK